MNKRDFNKVINQITTKKKIDIDKVNLLSNDNKNNLVFFIVKNRGPILKEFITENIDISWLNACGYLQETKGKEYTFIHTSEHRIK
jgi:hypothetical protein